MSALNLSIADEFPVPFEELEKLEREAKERDAGGGDAVASPTKKDETDPELGVEELKKQLAAEKLRADQAEALATQQRKTVSDTNRSAISSQLESRYESTTNALALAQNTLDNLVSQQSSLMGEGKFDEAAKLSISISRETAKVDGFANEKAHIEERRKAPQEDPVESFIKTLSQPSQIWVNANPRFRTDEKFRNKVFAADADARAEGITTDTPEYFRHLEQFTGLSSPKKDGGEKEGQADPQTSSVAATGKSAASVAAPPSRSSEQSGTGGGSGKATDYILSREQAEAASDSNLTPAEYVKATLELIKEGKLPSDALKRRGG